MNKIWIVGDSTVTDNTPPFRGWGWALPAFLRGDIAVRNLAESGCSTRSFLAEGRFAPAEQEMAPGDLLMIQFGHNDEKDDERHTDPDTTYRENLRYYCCTALEHGAQPVLLTPVSRRFFVGGGSMLYTHGEYPRAVREVAKEDGIPLIDLKAASRSLYLSLGEEKTAELFVRLSPGEHPDFPEGHDDKTHFNAFGAETVCSLVVREMQRIPACSGFLADLYRNTPDPAAMRLIICGDSTAADFNPEETPIVGWGQLVGNHLKGAEIINRAIAGRSTKTFLQEGRLEALDGLIVPGSLTVVQFGHNDGGNKPERHTEPRGDYMDNLRVFIRFVRDRGGLPVLMSSICIRLWENGVLQPSHLPYREAMMDLAAEEKVPFIDLYNDTAAIVRALGEEGSRDLYRDDNTHTLRAGADLFARAAALRLASLAP